MQPDGLQPMLCSNALQPDALNHALQNHILGTRLRELSIRLTSDSGCTLVRYRLSLQA